MGFKERAEEIKRRHTPQVSGKTVPSLRDSMEERVEPFAEAGNREGGGAEGHRSIHNLSTLIDS